MKKVRVVWKPSEKLFMGGSIGLIKGYTWMIILDEFPGKIHDCGGWELNMNGKVR